MLLNGLFGENIFVQFSLFSGHLFAGRITCKAVNKLSSATGRLSSMPFWERRCLEQTSRIMTRDIIETSHLSTFLWYISSNLCLCKLNAECRLHISKIWWKVLRYHCVFVQTLHIVITLALVATTTAISFLTDCLGAVFEINVRKINSENSAVMKQLPFVSYVQYRL